MTMTGTPPGSGSSERRRAWRAYGESVGVVFLCNLVVWLLRPYLRPRNLVMVYLLGVVLVATRSGRWPSVLTSLLSVLTFVFFFIPPYLTFGLADTEFLVMCGVLLVVALVVSGLGSRVREQANAAEDRERKTAALYALSRELGNARTTDELLRAGARHVTDVFAGSVSSFFPDQSGRLLADPQGPGAGEVAPRELEAAEWVYKHGLVAGFGTARFPDVNGIYLPLVASRGALGVLGIRPATPPRVPAPEQFHLLEAFAGQLGQAIERVQLAEEAYRSAMRVETERFRNSVLSSISHDLRSPLATVIGAAGKLLDGGERLAPATRRELEETIYEETTRLFELVNKILDMTRLESGVQLHREWHAVEDIVGTALTRLERRLHGRPVTVSAPEDLPLVLVDEVLIVQVLVNLLDNALKYSPAGSPLHLTAVRTDAMVRIDVADEGPGFPFGDEERIFEKFYHADPAGKRTAGGRQSGLGLTICRAIVDAHHGRIWAENRPSGGAMVRFTLPGQGAPPIVEA